AGSGRSTPARAFATKVSIALMSGVLPTDQRRKRRNFRGHVGEAGVLASRDERRRIGVHSGRGRDARAGHLVRAPGTEAEALPGGVRAAADRAAGIAVLLGQFALQHGERAGRAAVIVRLGA